MIFGLYQSAGGVMTNSYRQDVIANNLANSETTGFKKDIAIFQQRKTQAEEHNQIENSNPLLEKLGGGVLVSPTRVDVSQGELEPTQNMLDVAIQGSGFFQVSNSGKTQLTRDGRFMVDQTGKLVLANGTGQQVLDIKGRPIQLNKDIFNVQPTVDDRGGVWQGQVSAGQIGVVDVPNRSLLIKIGGNMLNYPDSKDLTPSNSGVRGGFIERANVDPASELAQLMDSQRQLEANANMIRYQDSTLQRLCNDVGKIS